MKLRGRQVSALDVVIAAIAALVLIVAAYLGLSVWLHNRQVEQATPASRATDEIAAYVRLNPNDIGARLQLAQALMVAGRESEAVSHYRAVLKAEEDNLGALSGLGFAASKRNEWKTAEGYWLRVIELLEPTRMAVQDQTLEKAYFYMGSVLSEQKRWEEAIPYFKAALRIRRDASDSHYLLAVAYREADSPEKYREELDIALAFDPSMPEANYDLGMLLLDGGDTAGAAEHFRRSSDAAPREERPRRALEDLGPYAERIEAARRSAASDPEASLVEARIAAALEPTELDALRLVATLHERTGAKDKALEAWRAVLAQDSDDASATAAVKRLGDGG